MNISTIADCRLSKTFPNKINLRNYPYLRCEQPTTCTVHNATRFGSFECCTPAAIIKPPMNIILVSFIYAAQVLSESRMPIVGKSTIGNIDVTGRGSSSNTQYIAIISTTYIHLYAWKNKLFKTL